MKAVVFFFSLFFTVNTLARSCDPLFLDSIDLKDYYLKANNLAGKELQKSLNQIIKGHSVRGYHCVWDILRIADQDPNNSRHIIGFYTRRSIEKNIRDRGQNDPDSWNREHIWARSKGIGSDKNNPAYSDAHHLRATDKSTNADRGSKDFANGGKPHSECRSCEITSSTWSPPDEVKGDTARMIFYMATRYEGDDGVSDLTIVNQTGSRGKKHGKLCDLLQWHIDDQPSFEEKVRNDIIYTYQGNRNPFIDRPEFANLIWGERCSFRNLMGTHDLIKVNNKFFYYLIVISLLILGILLINKRKHKKVE